LDACDANDDGSFDISDAIYQLGFPFLSGPGIPPPFEVCARDSTEDRLSCRRYSNCP
jgi:hypothetical protein